jgi:hypothetical protein
MSNFVGPSVRSKTVWLTKPGSVAMKARFRCISAANSAVRTAIATA